MAIISTDDVRALAKISAIHVSPEEVETLRLQLSAVLTYASSLKDVAGATAAQADLFRTVNVVRPDRTEPYDSECLLARAPEREGHFFVVPVIVK